MKTERNLIQICLLGAVLLQTLTNEAQPLTQISGGGMFSLFLKSDGSLWATGRNVESQLGDGTSVQSITRPKQILAGGVTTIAAGGGHSLLLMSDGSLWVMGYNYYGALGDGTYINANIPKQVVSSNVIAMAGGSAHINEALIQGRSATYIGETVGADHARGAVHGL